MSDVPILRLAQGIRLVSVDTLCGVPPFQLTVGQWAVLVPETPVAVLNPAEILARALVSLYPPVRGTVEILGQNAYGIPYRDVQRLRSRLGFVQGFGGLLSNRSLRDNIRLPVSEHARFSLIEEQRVLADIIEQFQLRAVAEKKPHEVDGFTRWRTCCARALVLQPAYVVLEGIGDWSLESGDGVTWQQLLASHRMQKSAICVCLSRSNPAFESWFQKKNGVVVKYKVRFNEGDQT